MLLFPADNMSHTNKNNVNDDSLHTHVDILEGIVKFSPFYLLGIAEDYCIGSIKNQMTVQ